MDVACTHVFGEFLLQLIAKAVIAADHTGKRKDAENMVEKCSERFSGRLRASWYRNGITCQLVYYNEQILVLRLDMLRQHLIIDGDRVERMRWIHE